ncbi:unnamed protein product [Vicia faba]|uniref:Uncharacterized protein n=1 Tax=Vicia faba TaxID=3906 RepID=A0AAV1AQ71_VICFA|nr:unnamed protein product [Vicia faba]
MRRTKPSSSLINFCHQPRRHSLPILRSVSLIFHFNDPHRSICAFNSLHNYAYNSSTNILAKKNQARIIKKSVNSRLTDRSLSIGVPTTSITRNSGIVIGALGHEDDDESDVGEED